jgi:Transposase DDE domain group 1
LSTSWANCWRNVFYGLALGYEDLNDHEELPRDTLLALMAGKRKLEELLAGKSTLNRLELTPADSPLEDRYHKITYIILRGSAGAKGVEKSAQAMLGKALSPWIRAPGGYEGRQQWPVCYGLGGPAESRVHVRH